MLFRVDAEAFVKTKRKLLEECEVYCIVSLPGGVFSSAGAGVKTNLVFFKSRTLSEGGAARAFSAKPLATGEAGLPRLIAMVGRAVRRFGLTGSGVVGSGTGRGRAGRSAAGLTFELEADGPPALPVPGPTAGAERF